MLIHTGPQRTVRVDLRLAVFLALIAGAINAAGFRSLGFFSGNMTGNVSAASDHLGLGQWGLAGWALGLVASFIAGAFASALLIERGRRRGIRGIYAYSILAEAAILLAMALADLLTPASHADPAILLGVAFALGLQNATTTRITDARVRTTHVTGISTDIGVELAILLGGAQTLSGRAVVRDRLILHGASLGAFLIGGVGGVLAWGRIGPGLFVLIALALALFALPEAHRARTATG